MLAVDTNVLVRYLARDDAAQFAQAEALIGTNDIFVPNTVLLETEWVLRRGYRYSRATILQALRSIAGLPRVRLENPARVYQALDWLERGMDFADALHLTSIDNSEAFITFDRQLIRTAARTNSMPVRAP